MFLNQEPFSVGSRRGAVGGDLFVIRDFQN